MTDTAQRNPDTVSKPTAIFFSQSFPPETHAGANRAQAIAEALTEEFHLTVVAPSPSHPHPGRFADADVEAYDLSLPFEVIRSRAFHPHAAGYVRRGLKEIRMASSLIARRLPKADVVVASSPSFFLGPLGLLMSRAKKAQFVWDLRDLTWVYANEGLQKGGNRRTIRLAAARAITTTAKHTLRHADVVIASNKGISTEARTVRPNKPIVHAPNGIDRTLHADLASVAARMPDNERIKVTYAGALGYFQALDSLLETAHELPEVDFELVGEGPERSRLETKARNEGLSNVTFTGYVDRTTLFGIYAQSDILFAQLRDLPVMSRATFPSKVYEYLAAGRPVVYAGSGITAEFLRSTEAAVIANPEDPESIRQSIAKLAGDEVLRQDMGIRAREASGSHIRQDIAGYVASRLRDSFNPVTVRVQPTALLARRMWKR